MRRFKSLLKGTALGRWALIPYRYWYATRYFARPRKLLWKWLFESRELVNFTYELTDGCFDCMAEFVSVVTGISPEIARSHIRELQDDHALRDHVRRLTEASEEKFVADTNAMPGKRYLYYALIRASKPKLIVEAGTEKGFGSCIMAAALMKNVSEGHSGRLECIDMSATAGYLFAPPYGPSNESSILSNTLNAAVTGTIAQNFAAASKHTGDSVAFIESLSEPIDLFFHDTTTYEPHEISQFAALENRLAEAGLVCSAWSTKPLMDFAHRTSRSYLVFHDEPKNHWYPGGSLAVVFPRRFAR